MSWANQGWHGTMRETRFSDFEPGGRGFDPARRASKFRAVRCEGIGWILCSAPARLSTYEQPNASGPRVSLEAPDCLKGFADLAGALPPALCFELIGKVHCAIVGDVFDDIGGPFHTQPPFAFRQNDFGRLENSHTRAPQELTA